MNFKSFPALFSCSGTILCRVITYTRTSVLKYRDAAASNLYSSLMTFSQLKLEAKATSKSGEE